MKQERANERQIARMLTEEPLPGNRFPKKMIVGNASKGKSGTSQAYSIKDLMVDGSWLMASVRQPSTIYH